MRNFILLAFLLAIQTIDAQEAQLVSLENNNEEIETILTEQYTEKNMDILLEAVDLLPLRLSTEAEAQSEEWLALRSETLGLYLQWYQKMFAAGFKLDDMAIIGAQSERNVQKNKAVKSYLIAEQRLKRYMKNNFKGNKKKQFKMASQAHGENYDIIAETIADDILHSEFGFIVYEKSLRVD